MSDAMQPPMPPAPRPPYPPYPQRPPQNGLGIAGMVLGIVSLVTCWVGLVPAILAIVFGRIGMVRADRGEASNKGMATAGFIMGIVGVGVWVLFIVLVIVLAIVGDDSPHRGYYRY